MSGIGYELNNGYEIFFDLLRIIRELCIERYVGIAVFPVSRYFSGRRDKRCECFVNGVSFDWEIDIIVVIFMIHS